MYAILEEVGTSLKLDSDSHCCVIDRFVANLENVQGLGSEVRELMAIELNGTEIVSD